MLKKKCNGRTVLLAVEIFILLILLPGCFRKEELVEEFWGEDICDQTIAEDGYEKFCSEMITLEPGVYQIRVWSAVADGQKMYVQMRGDNEPYKSLRNNGVTFFDGSEYDDFEVYVLNTINTAYVQCDFYNADTDSLLRLELWRTSMGRRMFLFGLTVFFGVLDFFVYFRKGIIDGRITKKQQVVFWTMTAGVLLAYFPYLTDYFSIGADSIFHWGRVAYLADELRLGRAFPVRVESTWLYGHGYASPVFYGDLFLYIPACIRLLGFSVMSSYKIFVLLVLILTAVIAYYAFKKCVKDEYAALFGSMVYLLIPYHLFNIYSRGAVGEYLAMTFLPLVCCGMYLLYTEDVTAKEYKTYKWYIIGGMSAILQSHLITTEMTAALMLLFCAALWKKTFRKQTFFQLFSAAGIVLLINAWFWVPMLYMLNKDTYHLQEVISEKGQSRGLLFAALFQLLPNKGSAQNGMFQCEPVQIGAGAVMLFLIYIVWRLYKPGKTKDKGCSLFAAAGALLVIMSTRYFPWDRAAEIPVIGYLVNSLQFPTRWMSPATLFAALFAAFFFRQIRDKGGKLSKVALGIAAAVTIMSAVYHVNSIVYEFGPVWLYNEENMGTVGVVNGEYLLEGNTDRDYYFHKPVAEDGLLWSEYEKRGTDVVITLDNTTGEERYLEVPLIGYKGYAVKELDSVEEQAEKPFVAEERGTHGDLRLAVPPGYQGSVQVFYQGFAIFHVAEAVSLVSLLALAGIYLYRRRGNK